ncbi:hypothetical protein KIN20_001871 [Parelaphostrongylus tenuis]|uniref:Uncharacterized protein n=1 Tax=Parelaphostrongylus tenuis TaxID=148309 RepID=A0AAD5MDE4_PARTN|nr:hypothetical protein KIN20_001871 [Parelaphostrongylus tenuis]
MSDICGGEVGSWCRTFVCQTCSHLSKEFFYGGEDFHGRTTYYAIAGNGVNFSRKDAVREKKDHISRLDRYHASERHRCFIGRYRQNLYIRAEAERANMLMIEGITSIRSPRNGIFRYDPHFEYSCGILPCTSFADAVYLDGGAGCELSKPHSKISCGISACASFGDAVHFNGRAGCELMLDITEFEVSGNGNEPAFWKRVWVIMHSQMRSLVSFCRPEEMEELVNLRRGVKL